MEFRQSCAVDGSGVEVKADKRVGLSLRRRTATQSVFDVHYMAEHILFQPLIALLLCPSGAGPDIGTGRTSPDGQGRAAGSAIRISLISTVGR